MESRPIQVFPSGLLGFLQMKNSGQNPAALPDTLQAVLELREWLWETLSQVVFVSSATLIPAATVAGNFTMLTVPPGEYWALLDVDMELNYQAGQTLVFRHQWREPTGRSFGLSDYFTRVGATTQGASMPRSYRIPIIGPGGIIGLHISTATMAGLDMGGNFEVRIARLPA